MTAIQLDKLTPQLGPDERDFVFAVAMKFVKSECDADDVAQNAMLLAHRHRQSFRRQSKYSTWLYRIAVTSSLMFLRTRKRKGREVSDSQLAEEERSWVDSMESKSPSPEQVCASREMVSQVDTLVRGLGKKYQDLLRMRWYEGHSERELGELLSLPVTTVKTRSYRARQHVLSHLAHCVLAA